MAGRSKNKPLSPDTSASTSFSHLENLRPPPDPHPRPRRQSITAIFHPKRDRGWQPDRDRDRGKSRSNMPSSFEEHNSMGRKPTCWSKLHKRLQEFSEETVMQGLGQILSEDLPWITRLIWLVVFTAAALACIALVGTSFERYLSFDVSTTTSLETLVEVEFPAITFCNENMLKKSMVQYSPLVAASLTGLTFGEIDDYSRGENDEWRTCAKNVSESPHGIRYDFERFKTSEEAYMYFRSIGMNKGMSMFALDSNFSVLKCWWKDNETDCSKLFLNHMTDYGWCFTMNPGEYLLEGFPGLGLGPNDTAYGLERTNYRQLILESTGPYNGFRTLLHVHQDEYCVTRSHGAGFTVLVHDADVLPLFFLERPISLSPGYETNVAIRFTKLTKKTADLGRCANFVQLNLYPHAVRYYRQACYMECFTDYVYDKCNCTPLYGPPRSNYIKKQLNNLTYIPMACWKEELIRCMKKHEKHFLDNDLDLLCDKCDPPCHDLHYDFQVSSTYFPAENFRFMYEREYGRKNQTKEQEMEGELGIDYLRSNLVSANFFVESMQVHVIVERQAMTLEELVGDVGAHIGFLLGLSVISLFELAQCCCLPRNPSHGKSRKQMRRGNL